MTEEVGSQDKPFRLEEATIYALQQAIKAGRRPAWRLFSII
jgi:hypothetical protein